MNQPSGEWILAFAGRLRPWERMVFALVLGCTLAGSGCVNIGAMVSKMVLGDPQIDASFKQQTGVTLGEKNTVVVYCTSRATVMDKHASLAYDLQKQVTSRMQRRKINVLDASKVWRAVDDKGGRADASALAKMFPECDYVLTIDVAAFDVLEPNSPNLLRGYAAGMIRGWKADGTKEDSNRHAVRVFEKEFQIEHPTHPVPIDSTSPSAFEKQFLDFVSDEVGRVFYDYRTSDVF